MPGQLMRRVVRRLRRAVLSPRRWAAKQVMQSPPPLIRLGSSYGGWNIVHEGELAQAVNILCGAGEDVSFDLALQRRFNCAVVIVDPTPRAIQHWRGLHDAVAEGSPYPVNRGTEIYAVSGVDFGKIVFLPYAVWKEDTTVEFWAPLDQAHVSYSIVNLQGVKSSISVQAKTLPSLMTMAGGGLPFGILKLDVEGAAADVLEAMLVSEMRPMQILAEFEELSTPTVSSLARLKRLVRRLADSGYQVVHFDGIANLSFCRTPT